MSAPSKAFNLQSVEIRPMQRLISSIEPTIARQAVTNVVKPMEGTYQAATQVKVLSPEISDIVDADVFHCAEGRTKGNDLVSCHLVYRGLSPWHGGHYNYFGVSGNYRSLKKFYGAVFSMVFKWINRRSQKKSMTFEQYIKYLEYNPLPKPRICYALY